MNNNPLRYTDPSGHGAYCGDDYDPGCLNDEEYAQYVQMGGEDVRNQESYVPFDSSLGGNNNQNESGIDTQNDIFTPKLLDNNPILSNAEDERLAGVLLIIFADTFIGVPCAWVIIHTGVVSPPAIAAEIIELFVVLPATLLGIYLIIDSTQK